MEVFCKVLSVSEFLSFLDILWEACSWKPSGVLPYYGSLRILEILEFSELLESSKFSSKTSSWKS